MTKRKSKDEWKIAIFVSESSEHIPILPEDDPAVDNSLRARFSGSARIARVSGEKLKQQWDETVDNLLRLTSTVSEKASGWEITEIEVGLTLSAKGELLFIAEAGAEASVKIKLNRDKVTPSPKTGS